MGTDYKKIMTHISNLSACTLITTGRTGTDFLQSLLDSHPQVLTFNGALFYHDFWKNSLCVAAEVFNLSDFLDEFIGRHIERFKSRYDLVEQKNILGEQGNEVIDIDLNEFKGHALRLLEGQQYTSKNTLLAIYAAYAMCLKQDILQTKVFFHHIHHADRLDDYLKDFPSSRIICMTRDPRANFFSGIENWRKADPEKDEESHLYSYIKRILEDATVLHRYANEYCVIRIEDLGKKEILESLCRWLAIIYNPCLERATWAGLLWHGDRLSTKKKDSPGWSANILKNNWQEKLSIIDQYIFNYIMCARLKHYQYSFKPINLASTVVVPFLIMFPLSLELRFFSFSYLRACIKQRRVKRILKNVKFYFLRVILFLKYYIKTLRAQKFTEPLLASENKYERA